MAVALTIVIGVILLFSVVLPVTNSAIMNNGSAANLTGYTGATAIANSSFLILVLAALAIAVGGTLTFFLGV